VTLILPFIPLPHACNACIRFRLFMCHDLSCHMTYVRLYCCSYRQQWGKGWDGTGMTDRADSDLSCLPNSFIDQWPNSMIVTSHAHDAALSTSLSLYVCLPEADLTTRSGMITSHPHRFTTSTPPRPSFRCTVILILILTLICRVHFIQHSTRPQFYHSITEALSYIRPTRAAHQ